MSKEYAPSSYDQAQDAGERAPAQGLPESTDAGLGNQDRLSRLSIPRQHTDSDDALADMGGEDWLFGGDREVELPFRAHMEQAFGEDLGGVRVRLGAAEALAGIDAEACAEGEELSFASPHPDKETVAHEVAHLVQARRRGRRGGGLSEPGQAAEKEAEDVGQQAAQGESVEVSEAAGGVMRKKENPYNRDMMGKTPHPSRTKRGTEDPYRIGNKKGGKRKNGEDKGRYFKLHRDAVIRDFSGRVMGTKRAGCEVRVVAGQHRAFGDEACVLLWNVNLENVTDESGQKIGERRVCGWAPRTAFSEKAQEKYLNPEVNPQMGNVAAPLNTQPWVVEPKPLSENQFWRSQQKDRGANQANHYGARARNGIPDDHDYRYTSLVLNVPKEASQGLWGPVADVLPAGTEFRCAEGAGRPGKFRKTVPLFWHREPKEGRTKGRRTREKGMRSGHMTFVYGAAGTVDSDGSFQPDHYGWIERSQIQRR